MYDYWAFGLYEPDETPITQGIKIVPDFPMLFFNTQSKLPPGIFGAISGLKKIGRMDFVEEMPSSYIFLTVN
jgi:hypothetical protein